MQIGELVLKHGLFLAPMAGYTDYAMRAVCRKEGAEVVVTEMISAKAVCFGDKKTASLARITAEEQPCALQIFGSDPAYMAEAAKRIYEGLGDSEKPAIFDINMGCPMRKIITNGEGGALMEHPRKIEAIVSAVKKAVPVPVSVKIRAGKDEAHLNAAECAKAAEAGGAAFVAVHGRTVAQLYTGLSDPRAILCVKEAVQIPVVGNGDIVDGASALHLKEQTGCDGIMVARGAVGNPFLFKEITAALEGRDYTAPTMAQRLDAALRHLSLACKEKGERIAVPQLRKQMGVYFHGMRGAAELRRRISQTETEESMAQLLICAMKEAENSDV